MSDWDAILKEAEWLAGQLLRLEVDLAEAEKAGDYYVSKRYSDTATAPVFAADGPKPSPSQPPQPASFSKPVGHLAAVEAIASGGG